MLAGLFLAGGAQAQPVAPTVTVTPEVGALKVTWMPVSNAVSYLVEWGEVPASGTQTYPEEHRVTSGESHTITGLGADKEYSVRVTARDANGDDSPASTATTARPIPGAVTGVKVTSGVGGEATSLMVSWTAVTGAADTDGYTVQWKSGTRGYPTTAEPAEAGVSGELANVAGTATSVPIPSLTADKEYTIRVRAQSGTAGSATDGGFGPWSAEEKGTPKPVQVTGVTVTSEEGALKVGWPKVTGATSYKVQWKSGGERYSTSRQATATPSGEDNEEATLTLRASTNNYTVRVIATNAGGDGRPSTEVMGRPNPGQVQNVRVSAAATPQQLSVSWNAVTGASSYKVQWKSGTDDYDATNREVTASGTSTTLGDGTAGTDDDTPLSGILHTVRVIATNDGGDANDTGDGGDGEASAEATGTPKPGQVQNLAAVTPNQIEQVTLNWDDVTGATGYTVQWKSGSQQYHSTRQTTTANSGIVIYDLTADTYMFRVFASNASGDGLPSTDATGTSEAAADNQVTGVRVTPGVGQLTIEWNPVAGATKYTVSLTEGGNTETYDRTRTRTVIPSLTSGTEYTVTVMATVGTEAGPVSSSVTGTPQPGKVQNAKVMAHADNPQQLTVTWDRLEGVAATGGYKVQWKSGSQQYDASRQVSVDQATEPTTTLGDATPATDTPLDGVAHTVRVISTNAGGDGPASNEVTGTPKPGQVGAAEGTDDDVVVTSEVGALMVKWGAIPGASSYKVQWTDAASPSDTDFGETNQATPAGTNHTIPDLEAGIQYTVQVIATNASGDGTASDRVTGTPKPGQVKNVVVSAATNPQQLMVTWGVVPGVSSSDGYKVQWKSGTQDYDASARQVLVTNTNTILGDGTEGTDDDTPLDGIRYTVRVIATNEATGTDAPGDGGDGPASAGVTGTPKPGQVGAATEDDDNVVVTSEVGALAVTWGAITGASGYKVQWKSDQTGEDAYSASRQASVTGTSHTIRNLSAVAEYDVQVIARNASGDGLASAENADNKAKPGQVTGVEMEPGVGTLVVTWDAVPGVSSSDGYKVQWKSATDADYDATNRQDLASTTSNTIDELTAGTRYTVRVIATNEATGTEAPGDGGDGPASAEVMGTPEPAQVTGVSAPDDEPEQLTVSWTLLTGDEVTGTDVEYKVQWKSGDQEYASSRQAITTETPYVIRNLTGGTAYMVQVIATVASVDGDASTEVTGTPGTAAANVVTGVRVTDEGDEQLTVQWNRKSGASGYTVEWRAEGGAWDTDGSDDRQVTGIRRTSHVITGLTGGIVYEVRVKVEGAQTQPSDADFVVATGTPTAATPPQVTEVEVTSTVTELTVSWKEVPDATYKIQWKTDFQLYASTREGTEAAGTTTHTIDVSNDGLKPGTLYMVRVQAIKSAAKPPEGPWSSGVTGMLKPAQVTFGADQGVSPGSEELTVSWTAVPGAASYKVQWKTASQTDYLTSGQQATVTGTEHPIENLEAGIVYTVQVTATNAGGDGEPSDDTGTNATGTPQPGKVTSVTVTPGSRQLMVSWTPVTVGPEGGYKVQWKSGSETFDDAATDNRQGTVASSVTSYTINPTDGLDAGTTYTVQVIASNDHDGSTPETDDGPASDGVTGRPKPGRVEDDTNTGDVDEGVTLTPGAGQLAVNWGVVTGATGYRVQWKKGSESYGSNRQATTAGLRHAIQNLTDTEYTVRVFASNPSGDGPASAEARGTPLSVLEGQVTNVRVTSGVGQLTVSWRAVTGATGYTVEWREETAGSFDPNDQATATGTSHVIENLDGGTEYAVQVTAVLPDDLSPPMSNLAYGTPSLEMVTNVVVTSEDVELLTVSWNAVSGATGYKVQWKSGSEGYAEDRQEEVSDTRYTISNLIGGTQYTVRVIATKGALEGSPSDEHTGTPGLNPDQVANVVVTPGQTQLTVEWDPVQGATQYKVQWKSGTQDYAANRQMLVDTGTRHVIEDLTADTDYTVRVIAVVGGNDGPASSEETGTPTSTPTRPPRPTTPTTPSTPSTPSTPTPQPPTTTEPETPTTPPTATPRSPRPGKVVLSSVKAGAEGGQLAVKWRVMGKTTGYKVQWKSGDQDFASTRQARVTGMLTTTYTIPDLDYTTEYSVQVIAFNTHGDGPASASRTGTPKQGKPKTGIAGMLKGDARGANAQQPRGSQSQVSTLGLDPEAHLDAGQEVTLTLTVAEAASYLLEVTGGRGVTLSGEGVLDQGGGEAQLDADSWSEGQRTVVLKDTVGPDTLSVVLRNTSGDSVTALEPRIVYNPEVRHSLVVTGLPDTLAVGRAYRGEVSVVDRYGNLRSDDREVVISADQTGVSSSSPVELEAGTGGFWVRSDADQDLVLTFSDSEESDVSQSVSVVVRPLDAPDRVIAADHPGDEGGFVLLTWDLSEDHSMINSYRIFRGADSTTEWAQVPADPDATEGRAVVATLDTVSSVWGVLAQRGGDSMDEAMSCAEIVVVGQDVAGLDVLVWRTGSGNRISSPRSSNILYRGTTDATGRVNLTVDNRGRSSYYAATARNADGEVVGRWSRIQLTPSECPSLELTLGGEAEVDVSGDQAPAVVLRSSVTLSGSARALDNTPPAAAGSFRAVDVPDDDGGQIQLSWTESTSDGSITRSVEGAVGPVTSDMSRGVVGYRIYRETDDGFAPLGTVGPGVTGFVDTTAITGIRFTYVVSAFDQDNETVSEEEEAMSIRNREEDVNGKLIQGLFGADQTVGFDDYFHFADHYGSTTTDPEWEPAFDLAARQAIDGAGLEVFAENFGRQTASAAKVVPLPPGRNEQTRLDFYGGVPLPRVGEEFVLTVHLSDFGLLKGYGFQLEFNAEELEVVRAAAADNGLGEGTLAMPQVLAVADGKRAIVAYGDDVSEGTLAVDIVFRALREFEGGFIKVSEGEVRDGAYAVNALALPPAVEMETLPEVYALGFNYPNPFNPETTIKYALPQASDVELVIYNSLGQVVRTLVNERQGAGRYAFTWDATNDRGQAVSSGIYLYRLQAGEFAKVRKMLLLK